MKYNDNNEKKNNTLRIELTVQMQKEINRNEKQQDCNDKTLIEENIVEKKTVKQKLQCYMS